MAISVQEFKNRVDAGINRLAAISKELKLRDGNLAALTTTDKGSLVGAINEVKALLASVSVIDDAAASSATNKTYSASKITALLVALKSEVLGGADAAFDTLKELQDALSGKAADIASLLAAVNNRVRYDDAQSLTAAQAQQVRDNIDAASKASVLVEDVDYVSIINASYN